MKAVIEQYFPVVLFVMVYYMGVPFFFFRLYKVLFIRVQKTISHGWMPRQNMEDQDGMTYLKMLLINTKGWLLTCFLF